MCQNLSASIRLCSAINVIICTDNGQKVTKIWNHAFCNRKGDKAEHYTSAMCDIGSDASTVYFCSVNSTTDHYPLPATPASRHTGTWLLWYLGCLSVTIRTGNGAWEKYQQLQITENAASSQLLILLNITEKILSTVISYELCNFELFSKYFAQKTITMNCHRFCCQKMHRCVPR